MTNLDAYLLVSEAAGFLGVSENTLRNWSSKEKIPTRRHPINGYRLYKKSDLEAFLKAVERSTNRLKTE